MSDFWKAWLVVWCWAVGLFGLVLAGAGLGATDGPARAVFALLAPGTAIELDQPMRFAVALMGAVTMGWSVTLLAAFRAAWALGDAAAGVWKLVTGGVLGWYVIDSVMSVATGFPLNAVSNTVLVAAYLLPVLRSGVLGGSAGLARA